MDTVIRNKGKPLTNVLSTLFSVDVPENNEGMTFWTLPQSRLCNLCMYKAMVSYERRMRGTAQV